MTFPLLIVGSVLAALTFENDLSTWLPASTLERQNYTAHEASFGSNEVVLLSWADCKIDNPVLIDVENELTSEKNKQHFSSAASGYSIDLRLHDSLKLSKNQRLKRVSGYWVNPENNLTFIAIKLSETGKRNRSTAFATIYDVLKDAGVGREEVRLVGPSVDLYWIDYEGFWSPLRAVPFISGVVFLVSWLFLRQLTIAVFVNLLGTYMATFSLTLVYLSGIALNSIVWPMPTLVILLTTSTSLHFLAYYREAMQESGDALAAPKIATRNALKATVLCTITTAVGLFSLMASSIGPVFQFGMFGGISVLCSCFAVLFWLPAWLQIFPYTTGQNVAPKSTGSPSVRWKAWAFQCSKWRKLIVISLITILLLLAIQLPGLRTGAANEDIFPAQSKLIQDLNWAKTNLNEMNPTEVTLEFKNADTSNDRDRLRWLLYLQNQLASWDDFSGASSAGIYALKPRKKQRLLNRIEDQARLRRFKSEFVEAGLVSSKTPAGGESWLLSLRGPALGFEETRDLTEEVEAFILKEFSKLQLNYFANEDLAVSTSGLSILNNQLEQQFFRDLILTYGTAFAIMSLLFSVIFRSWKLLATSIIPNLFPAVMVLGGLSAIELKLDVGSLMTASVALGIAVDDTLHFLLWWRKKSSQGLGQKDAIADALQYCGIAMLQTTVVFAIGLSLYAFCGFLPTVRFGLLLSGMMIFAIVGDLLLIPALLSTRLGKSK
jgi:predicted RND superfamily exporter protein